MGLELIVAGLVFPPLVVGLRQLVGGSLGRVSDGGDQGDQLAGAVAVAVGELIFDDPHQRGLLRVEVLPGPGELD